MDVVKFEVACKHDRRHVYVEVLCVTNICSPLMQQNINSVKRGFMLLINDYADSGDGKKDVDVNVLITIFPPFVTGKVIHDKEGHDELDSKFEWILCGGKRLVVDT